jgi:hypothetical protein
MERRKRKSLDCEIRDRKLLVGPIPMIKKVDIGVNRFIQRKYFY